MQNCFRQYPEVYGSELEPEDEDDVASDPQQQPLAAADATAQPTENVDAATPQEFSVAESEHEARAQRAKAATEQVKQEFGEPIKDHVKSIVADEKSKTTKEPSETDEVVQKEEKN
jgi:intermembrane space import and assembly protein 40